jgi:hypothetical protein
MDKIETSDMFCNFVLECLCCTIIGHKIGQVELFSTASLLNLTTLEYRIRRSEGYVISNRAETFERSPSRRVLSSAGNVLMASRKTFYEAAEEHMRAHMPTLLKKVEHWI